MQAPPVVQLAADRDKADRARTSRLRTSTNVFGDLDDMNNR